MGTADQIFRRGSTGSLLVPRNVGTSARPCMPAQSAPFETTGGPYPPAALIVAAEEKEWASLLTSERKALAKRRIKPSAVDKAAREVRYGK
jgi:hypothetical protein